MQNILIVEPEKASGSTVVLQQSLCAAGYAVRLAVLDARRADEALMEAFAGRPPDVLIADLSGAADCLPLRHIRRLLQNLWGEEAPRPLSLALCSLDHLRLPDLPAYTDDFLLPPYGAHELLARINLLLFRRRHIQSGNMLRLADVSLDLEGRIARDADHRILPLRPREYDLLQFLAVHRGKLFARDRLLDMVWGLDFEGGSRTVDIHIRRLRAKLPPATAALLETRRGTGYGFLASPHKD